MLQYGEHFEHNIQSLRAVDSIERRYPRFPGLNLTFEVREGIVKHSRDFRPGESPLLDEYMPGLCPPLEAQLIDLADEVAYNTADIDDAYGAGLVTPEQIAAEVPAYYEILDAVETQFPGASERERFQESIRNLVDDLVSGLIEGTVSAARAASATDTQAVREYPERIARFSPEALETSRQLKRALQRYVYCSVSLVEDRRDSIERLTRMFEYLMKHPEAAVGLDPAKEPRHRAVCDFIAGMTDRYFFRVYESLFPA